MQNYDEGREAEIYRDVVVGVFEQFNVIEMLAFLGLAPLDLTSKTYLYVTAEGEIDAVEKQDRSSRMEDEFCPGYYITDHGWMNEIKHDLTAYLETCGDYLSAEEQFFRDRDDMKLEPMPEDDE